MFSALLSAVFGLLILFVLVLKYIRISRFQSFNSTWIMLESKYPFTKKWWFSLIVAGLGLMLLMAPINQMNADKLGLDRDEYNHIASLATQHNLSVADYLKEVDKSKELKFTDVSKYFEAKKFGLDNPIKYAQAVKLGAKNMDVYNKYLADMKKRNISDIDLYIATLSKEQSEREKQKEIQVTQNARENSSDLNESGRDPNGYTKNQWRNRCQQYASVRSDCAVAPNLTSCIEIKLGEQEAYMDGIYCNGSTPNWNIMGSFK
jgi:hypothetical protein